MDAGEYATMFAVEDRHWWYLGMQRITLTLISRLALEQRPARVLDAGCGTGAAMEYLAAFGTVTGCDLSPLALPFCRQRGLARLSQATITHLPFDDGCFDLVTSFDVLYHQAVEDCGRALAEFRRVLRPGGHLFLRLPAYNWLRGRHDLAVHTARRFTVPEVGRILTAAGFAVEKLSYANTLLFPLALGKRLLETANAGPGQSDVHPNAAWVDALLARFLYAEARWLSGHRLPFGLSVIGIGSKP